MATKEKGMRIACQATSIPAADDRVPDMGKRQLMNLLLLGALSSPTAGMLVPYTYFFVPSGGLFCGLFQGDPTYLVVEKDKTLATFGINAVCTHLGCVVPWNQAEKKFIAPCHGSQYNDQGRVVRGPAPLVIFVPWVETDFRTGDDPWWA
uniref:plastoquinol--plastocyanin reductase n=1 Tax=Salix viminalis TaxID=40686 RepID=A0A6N2M2A5_SALVM